MAIVYSDTGKAITSLALKNTATSPPKNVGWGAGAGTAAVGDTTLFTEDTGGSPAYARIAGTQSQVTTTLTNDTYQVVATIVSNGTKGITNAGVFDALTGGNLLCKADFAAVNMILNDSIQFSFSTQFIS